ncbi:ribonuclease HII, partial [Candidatus Woesearchaeota archaeon]|nr:ribonuclease HII [Candidatus Woesearchaeota archaeon]
MSHSTGFCGPIGPVIGPLVLAGVCIEEEKVAEIEKLNLKDSKQISPNKRKLLFKKIISLAKDYRILKVDAKEIDSRKSIGLNLNELEALKCAELINSLKPDTVYVDSPISPRASKFGDLIRANLKNKGIKIVSEHKADEKYPIVSAASILAKVTRDKEIEKIKEAVGFDFGSGYPADERTIKFLEEHWENKLAQYIRKSWGT